jgi:small conductance mechanosensitive channel
VLTIASFPELLRQFAEFLRLDAAEVVRKLVSIAFIWLLAFGAWRLVRLIARRIVQAVDDGDASTLTEREQRGQTIAQLLRSVGRVVITLVALLITLNQFVDIGPLLAGAGILGLAFSFGAQSLVKDIITGFFYLLEGQFAVGDVIEVSGKSGVVERMTLRVVMLRDSAGSVHIIPNGQIAVVTNMTRQWSRAVVDVGIAYGTDPDRAIEIFRDEAEKFSTDRRWRSRFDGAPEVVGVDALGENQVTIRTLLRTSAGQQWAVGREFRRRMLIRLEQERIRIPFPQREITLRIEDAAAFKGLAGKAAGGPSRPAHRPSGPEPPPESEAPIPPDSPTP